MDKKFGKNVEKVLDFLSFVDDYNSWYSGLTKREGNIVGNGRVPYWLDSCDVDRICKRLELTPRQTIAIAEEFDEDRLNGIYDHCCEMESNWYVDWRGGCAYTDHYKVATTYRSWLRFNSAECESCEVYYNEHRKRNGTVSYTVVGSMDYYHKKFIEYREQGHTFQSLWNEFQKEHKEEIKMLGHLQLLGLDTKHILGGKYPVIAKTSVIDLADSDEVNDFIGTVDDRLDTNKEFFKNIKENVWSYYHTFDSVKDIIEFVDSKTQEMREMREAVEFVVEYIDDVRKGFKSTLTEQLEHEISEFICNEHSVEERVEQGLAKINHVEIGTEDIVTDMHASVPIIAAKSIIVRHNNGESVVGEFVGQYKINKVFAVNGETYFKIGCHLLKLSEVVGKLAM